MNVPEPRPFDRGSFPTRAVPREFVTASIPGTGGVIRTRPEDFVVEEIPAYPPSGDGEHLYLTVRKTNLATLQLVAILARHFRVRPSAVGYAGLKDKVAVTTQVFTVHVPGRQFEAFRPFQHPRAAIVEVARHANKLRRGHLRGNRFSIGIRGASPGASEAARATLQALSASGVPNRFGPQRFGHAGSNHFVGRALLVGDDQAAVTELVAPPGDERSEHAVGRSLVAQGRFAEAADTLPAGAESEAAVLRRLAGGATARQALRAIGFTARSFYLSAFQSAVFNAVLDARLSAGTWNRLLDGDLAQKHDNQAVFAVDGATAADPATLTRVTALEVSPSGPMWGLAMPRCAGAVDALESEALLATGVDVDAFVRLEADWGERLRGDRRPLRVPLGSPAVSDEVDEAGPCVRCGFDLPAGSFATTVMAEITKT